MSRSSEVHARKFPTMRAQLRAALLVLGVLFAGINAAQAACPAGQAPTGPNGACMCANGTPPLQGACIALVCQPGQPMTASGICCAPNTTPQPDNTCTPNPPAPKASSCPLFQVPGPNGSCVCYNGNAPPAAGCPPPHVCIFTTSCCPAGQQTYTGTCCPQGQMPLADGSCGTLLQEIVHDLANQGLCPASQTLQPDGTCLGYAQSGTCTVASPLPTSIYGGSPYAPAQPCCTAGQLPATTGVPPSNGAAGSLQYTGTCCPAGQVPQPNGSCLPYEPFVTACPGSAPFNAQTNTCCPAGSTSITNRYVCCPAGTAPQPNGTCGCPANFMTQSDGSCTYVCPPNAVVDGQFCSTCPQNQLAATQTNTCCDAHNVTTNGYCCPPGRHANGAWCAPGTQISRPVPINPPARCAPGLVPREAVAGDDVCVPPRTRDQAQLDNTSQLGRTKPDGGCVSGYVWREARPDDHVCVTPPTRAQTWTDNGRACGGDRRCGNGVVPVQNPVTAQPALPARPAVAPPSRKRWSTPRTFGTKRGFSPTRWGSRGRAQRAQHPTPRGATRKAAPRAPGRGGGRRR